MDGCGLLRLLRGGDGAFGLLGFGTGGVRAGGGLAPAGEDHPRLGNADLLRQADIALRRLGLTPQAVGAGVHVGQDFVQPHQIRFGGAQLLFGILAPDVQAGNARRFLQHGAAFLRAGGNHGGDAPLADQSGAMRAGGGVREDQRHVLRPDVAAIGAIGAARPALDPAGDFQFPVRTDFHRVEQLALFLDGEQRDFREIALRAGGGAREDHILHAAAAHRLGAGFAHDPADRLQQVRLAAAIGPDNAGQAGFDAQLRRVDEALEAGELEALYLHRARSGQRGAAPPSAGSRTDDVSPPLSNQIPASLSFVRSAGQAAVFSTVTPFRMKVGVPSILYC